MLREMRSLPRRECFTRVKKNNAIFTAPIYVTVVMILLGTSGKLLEITAESGSDDLFFTAMILELFVYMIPAAFYCKLRGMDMIKSSGTRFMSLSDLPFVISAFFLYALGMIFLMYFGAVPSSASEINLTLQSVPETDSFFVILCYIVIPAVAEEMLFRSVLLSEYSSCRGLWAIVVSSLFFAMLHFSFTAFPSYFWAGFVFGLITYVTRSAIPAVILHMFSNFATINFSQFISGFLDSAENSVVLIFLLSTAFLIALYFTLSSLQSIYERKAWEYEDGTLEGSRADAVKRLAKAGKVDKKSKNENSLQRISPKDIFLSPTVLLAVAVFVFMTLEMV